MMILTDQLECKNNCFQLDLKLKITHCVFLQTHLNGILGGKVRFYLLTFLLTFLHTAQFVGRCTDRNVSSPRTTSICHVLEEGGPFNLRGRGGLEFLFLTRLLVHVDGCTKMPESSTAADHIWRWGRDSPNFWCC